MDRGEKTSKRTQSATARLPSSVDVEEGAPPIKERSISAHEAKRLTKHTHEASAEIKKIFPRNGGVWKSYSAWGRTSYNSDFGPKPGPSLEQTKARPSSRTRLNNPHPNQSFLQWRIPVRLHGDRKVVAPSMDTLADAQESFYDDYLDHTKNFRGLHNDVVTNVAKIPFPGGRQTQPHHLGVAGMKLQLNSHQSANETALDPMAASPTSAKQSRAINSIIKEGNVPVFKEWLDTANAEEKHLVLDMLQAGDSEERRIQRAAEELLQPDALPNVQEWLTTVPGKEKKMLLNVLESLAAVNPTKRQRLPVEESGHARSFSYPPNQMQFQWTSPSHSQKMQQYSRYLPPQPKRRPKSAALSHHSNEPGSSSKTPTLWNHKLDRDPVCNVIHPASVFNLPHKNRGKHFTIHPEWPTA